MLKISFFPIYIQAHQTPSALLLYSDRSLKSPMLDGSDLSLRPDMAPTQQPILTGPSSTFQDRVTFWFSLFLDDVRFFYLIC